MIANTRDSTSSTRGLTRLICAAAGLLAAVVLPPGAAHAQPRFADYPAKVTYSGKPAPVDLASHRDARRFRTRLRRGAARGPNFAGAYTVVTWGCGTACQMIAVVAARNGKVAFAPGAASAGVTFRRGSRLLVFKADNFMNQPARYLVFENGTFRKVR